MMIEIGTDIIPNSLESGGVVVKANDIEEDNSNNNNNNNNDKIFYKLLDYLYCDDLLALPQDIPKTKNAVMQLAKLLDIDLRM